MQRWVIDSSVAIKWFVPEVGSRVADQVLERYKKKILTFLVPDLFFAELGNIVWKKRRLQTLDPDDAQAIIYAIPLISFEIMPASELLAQAYELATDHERTVYDSIYLALSLAKEAPFLTADEKLFNAVGHAMPNVFLLHDSRRLETELDHRIADVTAEDAAGSSDDQGIDKGGRRGAPQNRPRGS